MQLESWCASHDLLTYFSAFISTYYCSLPNIYKRATQARAGHSPLLLKGVFLGAVPLGLSLFETIWALSNLCVPYHIEQQHDILMSGECADQPIESGCSALPLRYCVFQTLCIVGTSTNLIVSVIPKCQLSALSWGTQETHTCTHTYSQKSTLPFLLPPPQ